MIINLQFNKSTHEIIDTHEPFAEITGMCVAKYLNEDESYINLEVFIDVYKFKHRSHSRS